ncbi:MAG: prepilin-type N-terminal cleavage/methylation domain-containing protein [Elusimicrobiaceae bacterium]|nr:prepilin-type N-terminal cleavage/methylation domain-containing protein [Elusimicrobiaceae bacterium]
MKLNKQAFTLIELLVVILIIGILAAVALPQYRLAVEKSRASEALTQVRAVAEAEKIYYLANGEYTNKLADLDIEITGRPDDATYIAHQPFWYISLFSAKNAPYLVYAARYGEGVSNANGRWYIEYNLLTNNLTCGAYKEDTRANRVCKAYGDLQGDCPWSNGKENCYSMY